MKFMAVNSYSATYSHGRDSGGRIHVQSGNADFGDDNSVDCEDDADVNARSHSSSQFISCEDNFHHNDIDMTDVNSQTVGAEWVHHHPARVASSSTSSTSSPSTSSSTTTTSTGSSNSAGNTSCSDRFTSESLADTTTDDAVSTSQMEITGEASVPVLQVQSDGTEGGVNIKTDTAVGFQHADQSNRVTEPTNASTNSVASDASSGIKREQPSASQAHLDDHGYSSLQDMIELDMRSHSALGKSYAEAYANGNIVTSDSTTDIAAEREMDDIDMNTDTISSTTTEFDGARVTSVGRADVPNLPIDTFGGVSVSARGISSDTVSSSLPPISSAACTIDLDSSVSNLSWLQNIQQQAPAATSANLIVNPQTAAPPGLVKRVGDPQRSVRVVNVAMPSNVHLSNTGNIRYVTVQGPASRQPIRISASKPLLNGTLSYSTSTGGYHRVHSHNSAISPSSTVPDNPYPKPAYSYSCLIALSLKNSRRGALPVAEIYNFMMTNFPYFRSAPDGWKNSVRHNLSLNKCFEKIENPNSDGTHSRKGCLWTMNPTKVKKMDEEIAKWNKKDLIAIRRSMADPDMLDSLTQGHGSYLMEKGRSNGRGQITASHFPSRPGIRIVTAAQGPSPLHTKQTLFAGGSVGSGLTQANVVVERQDQIGGDQIDFNRLVEDAADLFGDHDDLTLDPSLSELALQNGMFEDIHSDIFELPPLCSQNNPSWASAAVASPASSKLTGSGHKSSASHGYGSSTALPIIF